jgi:hypothetical protein
MRHGNPVTPKEAPFEPGEKLPVGTKSFSAKATIMESGNSGNNP